MTCLVLPSVFKKNETLDLFISEVTKNELKRGLGSKTFGS